MDKELFELACQAAQRVPPKGGIGVMAEYRLHNALKYYVQPDNAMHELKVDGYVCDAVRDDGIVEIQSRNFRAIKNKLGHLLEKYPVTVVYPVIVEKTVITTYEATGEATVRKSPKKMTGLNIFSELAGISELLGNKDLHFRVIFVKCEEHRRYRCARGERRPFEKPIARERIPTEITDELCVSQAKELADMLPGDLPENFDAKILATACGIDRELAYGVIKVLSSLGVIEQICMVQKRKIYRFI